MAGNDKVTDSHSNYSLSKKNIFFGRGNKSFFIFLNFFIKSMKTFVQAVKIFV